MRIWYISGDRLQLDELEQSPTVGEILHGKEVSRVWPEASDPFHRWRVLFEAGVLGVTNLEAAARQCGLWEPSERVSGYIEAMGFELQHVPGATSAHQMVFRVQSKVHAGPHEPGEGVFPLEAVVDFARRNKFAPSPQSPGTVVPMPALRKLEDGTLAGPGIAIGKRLAEFMAEEHNRMLPKDWTACLLNFAAYYAIAGGCTADGFNDLAALTYARVAQDHQQKAST